MVKVSVIIPIYQVAPYIEKCAESLFGQTLQEMQFVFIDDGSSDNSCELLEKVLSRFPERKEQTLIIRHKGNLGLPATREEGLRHAVGEYVAHCDGDDWVERDMYAVLYESAKTNDADMVICETFVEKKAGEPYWWRQTLSPDGDRIRDLLRGKLDTTVWCRLTRTSIYRKIRFPRENYLEDWGQTVQTLAYSRVVNMVHKPLYHYRFNPDSISRRRMDDEAWRLKAFGERTANFALMHDFVIENELADEEDLINWKINVRSILFPLLHMAKYRSLYMNTYPEINRRLLFCRRVSFAQKIIFLLILFHLYPLLYRIRRCP